MEIKRKIGDGPVFWSEDIGGYTLSAPDIISLLGKGTPRRGYSLVERVRSLPIDHVLEARQNGPCRVSRVSFLGGATAIPSPKLGMQTKNLAHVLREVVSNITRTYKKVGLLLSGGFDSTVLAYLLRESDVEVIGYTAESPEIYGQKEWRYAKRVADLLNFSSYRVEVSPASLMREYNEMIIRHPTPIMCWITESQAAISKRAAHDGCDCLISGIGSDELFGGYHKTSKYAYRFDKYAALHGEGVAWANLLNPLSFNVRPPFSIGQCCPFPKSALTALFPDMNVGNCLEEDVIELYREVHTSNIDASISAALLQLELELRTSDILTAELATASSMYGLTVKYPFLHPDVLFYAAQTPISEKYSYGLCEDLKYRPKTKAVDKFILRKAFENDVPRFVHVRPRNTFTLPYAGWLNKNDNHKKELDYILNSPLWREVGADTSMLAALFNGDLKGDPWRLPFRLWVAGRLCSWWELNGVSKIRPQYF